MAGGQVQAHDKTEAALRDAGWRVCDLQDLDLGVGGVAVRASHPTAGESRVYLLYVDHDLVGLIAAGEESSDPSMLLAQADELAAPLANRKSSRAWLGRPLPFRYGTNGHAWRFRNVLDAEHLDGTTATDGPVGGARSRIVFAPARPATVARWKREALRRPTAPSLQARLRQLRTIPSDPKRQLRQAQRRAVEGLERSLAQGDQRALIQMATGAGKTYTVVQASHRLLKYAGAHRVLFLVDRNNLGTQAFREYHGFIPAGAHSPLHQDFPLKHLSGSQAGLADSDKIVISTIQRLWCKLSGQPLPDSDDDPEAERFEAGGIGGLTTPVPEIRYSPELPPDYFDFIVVDECHRSIYGTWRPVLEYFDARIVGLTATPIGPTFAFFDDNLVSQYAYEEAVADKVNVDYDVYEISTRITREGSMIPATTTTVDADGTVEQLNTVLAHIDRMTRKQHWQQQDEDDPYGPTELNERVESTSQIRTVVQTFKDKLFTEIFPPHRSPETAEVIHERHIVPKTLIFAANDRHADAIVEQVRQVWNAGDDFCKKITSRASRPDKTIRDFRNSPETRIAVTVDMIATGTDIPALECLVFMRDIRTWSYFEQMKGRGARSITQENLRKVTEDAVCKDRFVIVDTVGVTKHPMVDARPLVRDGLPDELSLERLLKACEEGRRLTLDAAATLAGRLTRLGHRLDVEQLAEIEKHAGGRRLTELVADLIQATDPDRLAAEEPEDSVRASTTTDSVLADAVRPFIERAALREALFKAAKQTWVKIDHLSQDGGVITQGATDELRAERTIRDWRAYMAEQRDQFADLRIVFQERRPLGEVRSKLDEVLGLVKPPQRPWTKEQIWKAYVDFGIARGRRRRGAGWPEFLSILRYELGIDGGEFRPYRETVELRFREWIARQGSAGVTFTDEQQEWLRRVADVVAKSATVSLDSLEQDAECRDAGGWPGFAQTFADSTLAPDTLLEDLDRELGA
ncbi:DEAD/DEAH box helicase family protein [Nonomuraea sp. NPDC051941]|uniref:DEAD/DEAH box helicase family protein n=1 Tax=Nonomuraea sp. NPDC051941 TaxID=3364373 RepID=UPI0037CC0C16